jgi:hypothetical protein
MQHYQDVVTDRYGNSQSSVQVTIKDSTGAVATIYSDDGVTTQSNPLTTDSSGRFSFYAANGNYTISASGADDVVVPMFDPKDPTFHLSVASSDSDQSIYGEDVQITNATSKTGYGVRFALYNHSGAVSSGENDIGETLICRWSDLTSGSAWGRWRVVSSPLPVSSGLTGAPSAAQSFAIVANEVNPQNRTSDPGPWKAEIRLYSNHVGGEQMVAETQDFSALIGSNRIGYNISFGYTIAKSPYASNYGTTEHAKFYNGFLVNPNAIAASGFAFYATGHFSYPTAIAISAAGSGYAVGNVLTFNSGLLGTLNQDTQVKVTSVNGSGGVTGAEIYLAGCYTQTFSSPIGVTGGAGTGAQFTYTLSTSAVYPRAWGGISGNWLYGIDACPNPSQRYAAFSNAFIRGPNNTALLVARNAADNADVTLLKLNSSDQPELVSQKILTRTDWTPTITADSGTFTTVTVSDARYSQINKIVQFQLSLQIVTVGTASGAFLFTPPVTPAGKSFAASGVNASDGQALFCYFGAAGSTVRCAKYDGSNPISAGKFYTITGTYEAAT